MTKVIEIEGRIEGEKRKKELAERRRAVAPLLHFLQCSCCRMKCRRCGSQADITSSEKDASDIPFIFCKECREEYRHFQQRQMNEENQEQVHPWHNSEWEKMWRQWIEYQEALRSFQRSKEVRTVCEELRDLT